ncbi:Crp/Fnr family transcriptional regulator [Pedobacter sp. AW31-3R]|uniref:Crp/Fnr family transcriptional regulator n=1 Tax=Pedobacter sp. AW31-3R TaxID=3445781 RepID=UPI003FA10306
MMNTSMDFREIVNKISPLPEESFLKLAKVVSEVKLPEGHLLFKSDTINNNIYFLAKGISRAYVNGEQNEITFGFFNEGTVLLSIKSYVMDTPGYENIELLEDCILFKLTKKELENLYHSDINLANWGRKLADISFLMTETQLITRQFRNSVERYEDFITTFPDLLQRLKLKYIASYLGMTQVTLSRIRAKDKKKLRASDH